LDGHKKRQRKMTNVFTIEGEKTKWDHPKAWMVLQIYMGTCLCTSKVKNDKEQNDNAFETKGKKKQMGSPKYLSMTII